MDLGQLRRYYLGGLTDDEQRDLESRWFEDDQLFAELMAGQEDLIHAYVRDQLSPTDRAAFEQHFLATPGGREKVRLARTLIEAISDLDHARPAPVPGNRWSRWLSALTSEPGRRWLPVTALAVVALISIGLLVGDWRLRARLESASAEYSASTERERRARQAYEAERARADRLAEAVQRLQSTSRPAGERFSTIAGSVVALSLTPGVTRAQSAPELAIPRGVSIALLELGLETSEPPGSYRVTIETPGGGEVWRQDASGPSPTALEGAVVLAVAVSAFEAGDYIVRLQRRTPSELVETLHTYQFRVVREAVR
jgi:hypothetical protein